MTDVRLSGAVMAHPRRPGPGRELIRSTRPGLLDLVLDPQPDGPPTTLRTAMRAWSSMPATSTHHLVLEDDAELSPRFAEHAERAAAAMPEAAIVFHTNWSSRNAAAVRLGVLAGVRWVRAAGEYTPTVALMLPAAVGAGFPAYAAAHAGTWAGDVVMSRYLRSVGVPTYLTVPNLVQHGDFPSLTDNERHGLRLSACYTSLPADADWDAGSVLAPDVIPFFKFGMAHCAVRSGPAGRWLTLGIERSFRRLGVDIDACLKEFPGAVPGLEALAPPVLESLWRAAYLTGFVSRRPDRYPDATAEVAAWAADPWVDEAMMSLGAGGLCMSFPARRLLALGGRLREVARSALFAGARAADRPAARPVRRRRVVVVAGKGQALGRCLAGDLTDRGYPTATVELDGLTVPVDELRLALRGADAVVHAGSTPPDELLDCVRSAEVPRFVHLATPDTVDSPLGTVLRLGTPYGPELDSAPLNDLVARALVKQPLAVAGGDRYPQRFIHVWDLGAVVDRVLATARPAASWDVCGAESVTPHELAILVARVVKPVPVVSAPDGGESPPPGRELSPERIREDLGWTASVTLADGIRTVAQWLAYEAD
jgi:hypothetical protein